LPHWSLWLPYLVFRPRLFFETFVIRSIPVLTGLTAWLYGIAAAMDQIETRVLVSARTNELYDSLRQDWTVYWAFALATGIVGGAFHYGIGGWWYRVRLRWCGAKDPDRYLARRVFIYASQAYVVPALLYVAWETLNYDSPAIAAGGDDLADEDYDPDHEFSIGPVFADAAIHVWFYAETMDSLECVNQTASNLAEGGYEMSEPVPFSAWGSFDGAGYRVETEFDGESYAFVMFCSTERDRPFEILQIIELQSLSKLEPGFDLIRDSLELRPSPDARSYPPSGEIRVNSSAVKPKLVRPPTTLPAARTSKRKSTSIRPSAVPRKRDGATGSSSSGGVFSASAQSAPSRSSIVKTPRSDR